MNAALMRRSHLTLRRDRRHANYNRSDAIRILSRRKNLQTSLSLRPFLHLSLQSHEEAIVSAKIKYCEGEHRYCTNEDLMGGIQGHPPDSFVAGAMAYRASSSKELQFF